MSEGRFATGTRRLGRWFLGAAMLLAACGPAHAEDAAAFYKGKTITILVGVAPGGGIDAHARLLAPYLGERLGATVVVANKPGAGGVVALNQLAAAEPDGLTLLILNSATAVIGQLVGEEGVRYDAARLNWLGRVALEERVVLWSAQSPFRTMDDALKAGRKVKWGSTGRTAAQSISAALLSEALGLDSLIIAGYEGGSEAALAAVRGEVDGLIASASSAKKYSEDGKMIPAVVLDRERTPVFPDVPTIFEAVTLSEDQAWWLDYDASLSNLGRALVTTPGVPADRLEALGAALKEALADPALLAEAVKAKRPMGYGAAEDLQELVNETLTSLDAERRAQLKTVLLEKYF